MNRNTAIFCLVFFFWLAVDTIVLRAGESGAAATFDIAKHGDYLFVPLRMGDQTQLFVLDTGATLLCLDSSLRNAPLRLLFSTRSGTAGEDVMVDVYPSPALLLGELEVGRGTRTVFRDLNPMRQVCGYPFYGILGMEALYQCVIQLDFDQGHLTLLKCVEPRNNLGTRIPIKFNSNGIPTVIVSLGGQELSFAIDTGAGTTCITADVLRSLKDHKDAVAVGTIDMWNFSGDRTATQYRLDRLSLGEFEHHDLLVTEGNGCRIGLDYLSRFQVTFDFRGKKMYLKKGSRHTNRDNVDLSGLGVLRDQEQIVVNSVSPNSAGESAQIQADDQITRIDEKDANSFSLFQIRQLLRSKEGRRIELEILRAGQRLNTVLTLKATLFHE